MGKYVAREILGYAYERVEGLERQRRLKWTPVDRSGKNEDQKTLEERLK